MGGGVVRNESWFRHPCCSFEPRRDTRARGRVRRRHSREPRDGEYAGAMPDGRGGVSALVRAAVASADASSLKVLDLSFNALVSLDDDGTPVEAGGCFASLPALEDLLAAQHNSTGEGDNQNRIASAANASAGNRYVFVRTCRSMCVCPHEHT